MMDQLIGTEVKGYELRELIGTGGFGAVYRAWQPAVEREVAVKVILPEHANQPTFIRRFETEARLVARLEHPYIVPLYDYWRDASGAYLVMRWLRGGSLNALVKRDGPISLERAAKMLMQIASALAVAHANDVVHRDLKPDNILLDENDNHYLSDFGIAKEVNTNVSLTQSGMIIGSPAYLSPEQISGDMPTPLSDVNSLGIMFHYALTGEHPYPGKTPTAMLVHHMQDPIPLLRVRLEDVPEPVDEVMQRATTKDPAMRFQDVMEMATAFSQAVFGGAGVPSVSQASGMFAPSFMTGVDTKNLINPYKGLRAFEEADVGQFYGREALTERLLNHLRPVSEVEDGNRLLVLVGPSGSGKSSVVKAGLLPQLRKGALPGSENWFVVEMVPGNHPMEELEAALLRVAVNPPESLLRQLQEDERGLLRAIKRVLPDDETELVLIVDQLEEVFTLVESEEERQHFLNSLMAAVQEPRNRLRLILTLRADFYDRPLSYHAFGKMVREYTEVILPLSPEELQRAIVAPAEKAGVVLEPGLAAAIVADVREQPGALPLLQYALTQLFEHREGNVLTVKAYDDIGRAMGALARRAEEIYTGLPAHQQEPARQLFLRLVTLGEGQEDTRRRILRSELNALGDTNEMNDVIDHFGKQRLLTFDNHPQTREPTIEVAHEALIRQWQRLRDWLDGSREAVRIQRRLAAAARDWNDHGQDPSFLATGTRLEQFEDWQRTSQLSLNREEAAYLNASMAQHQARLQAEAEREQREEELEQRARTRLRALVAVLSVAFLLSAGLAGLAYTQQRAAQAARLAAERNEEAARRSAAEAQSVALAANALNLISNHQPNLALQLALAAVEGEGAELIPAQQALAVSAYTPAAVRQHNPTDEAAALSAVYSWSGQLIAMAMSDGRVFIQERATGDTLTEIAAHNEAARSVVFTLDDAQVISAACGARIENTCVEGNIAVWDAISGDLVRELEGHDDQVNALALSPDGQLLLSGAADGTVLLWNLETGAIERELVGHEGPVLSVDYSNTSRVITSSAGDERSIRVWNANNGIEIYEFSIEGSGWVRAATISPDGNTAATASYDPNEFGGIIRVWDLRRGQLLREMVGHTDVITTLDFSPDGTKVISGAWDRTVRIWDVASGTEIERFDTLDDRLVSVRYGPFDDFVLAAAGRESGSTDTRILEFDLLSRAEVDRLTGHADWLWAAQYSPDTRIIATGSGKLNQTESGADTTVRLWNAENGEEIIALEGHTDTVHDVTFSPDGSLLATSSWDNTVIVWDVSSPSQAAAMSTLIGHEGRVNAVAFSPDGATLLTASSDGTLRQWDVATGAERISFGQPGEINFQSMALSPSGDLALTGSTDSLVRLWDVASGEERAQLVGHQGWINTVAFSPDGALGLSGADNDLLLWDIAEGTEIQRFVGHRGFVYGGAFSPDGQFILSGASDTTVRLWNAETTDEIRRFEGHTNWVLDVAFSPDGSLAVSAAEDNTARIWRIARSLDELTAWAAGNRYLAPLTCADREVYRIEPLCDDFGAEVLADRVGR